MKIIQELSKAQQNRYDFVDKISTQNLYNKLCWKIKSEKKF